MGPVGDFLEYLLKLVIFRCKGCILKLQYCCLWHGSSVAKIHVTGNAAKREGTVTTVGPGDCGESRWRSPLPKCGDLQGDITNQWELRHLSRWYML